MNFLRILSALLALSAAVPPSAQAQADPKAAAVTLSRISITVMGRGNPVVLIPGLSSPRQVWADVAPRIARDHRVLLVQVNGFGGDGPGDNLKPGLLDGVVAELSSYIAAHKVAKVDVIGHSMGGLLALMLAKIHPDMVGKLMIVDALPWIGDIFAPGATVAMLSPKASMLKERMAAQYGKP